ncbi:7-carboxy-7-deazaguanine synthase QueE [Candidatus Margulisiibacteriota bacterium]
MTAHLAEIFSSIQGEGSYVGERQLFLRFCSCNLNCEYCDTPSALTLQKECRVEQTPGQADFEKIKNPLSQEQLLEIVNKLNKNKHLHSALTLTGGEPLLQVDFLLKFLPAIKKDESQKIYLETNGTLPQHMNELVNLVDIVAMDMKLESTIGQSFMAEHEKFLEEVAYSGTEIFVKLPVDNNVKTKEIDEVAQLIEKVSADILLIIQPIYPVKVKKEKLLSLQAVAKRKLKNVRIIPQIHKQLGMF